MAPHRRTTKFAVARLGMTGVAVALLPGLGLPGGQALAATGAPAGSSRPGGPQSGDQEPGPAQDAAGQAGPGSGAQPGSQFGAGSPSASQAGGSPADSQAGPGGPGGSGGSGRPGGFGGPGSRSHGGGRHGAAGGSGGGYGFGRPGGFGGPGGPGIPGGPPRSAPSRPGAPSSPPSFPLPSRSAGPVSGTSQPWAARAWAAQSSGASPYGPGLSAAPMPGENTAKSRIAQLYQQAEAATQAYDAAQEQAGRIQSMLPGETAQAQQLRTRLAALTTGLGRLAAQQYRSAGVDPEVSLMFSAHPDAYLAESELLSQNAAEQRLQLHTVLDDQAALSSLDAEAGRQLADLRAQQAAVAANQSVIQGELAAARQQLNGLARPERIQVAAALARGDDGDGLGTTVPAQAPTLGSLLEAVAEVADGGASDPSGGATSAPGPGVDPNRVLRAVSAAYSELGKPYVWGATGPDDFDCSGLTQHVWAAAGVALPRTSEEQADIGAAVPISQIQPGDLVVYFSGRTHVALYVGQGLVIHAPRPGSVVQFASLTSMPINKIVRPTG